MESYILVREIQVNEKASDKVVKEIPLPEIDVNQLTMFFGAQPDDPLFYGGYEISPAHTKYFPNIKLDLDRYDYYVVCYRELSGKELEILTVNRYFQKEKARRFVDFILNDKKRPKFISALAHLKDLDYSKFQKVKKDEKELVLKIMTDRNLSKCYVISENKRIDQQFMSVEEALTSTIGYGMGTIIVFGDSE
ncbi:MAG TPA: hypothetical protein VGZ71_16815, partial [Puia sp.]|nr:hypothetical protein [Puia sp.]